MEIQPGDWRKAWDLSLDANATHRLRRTATDVGRVIDTVPGDEELKNLSDREVVTIVGVNRVMINRHRRKLACSRGQIAPREVRRAGTTYTMDTKNIGNMKVQTESPPSEKEAPPGPTV